MKKTDKFEELRQLALAHVWVPTRPWNILSATGGCIVFTEGKGRRVTDIHGKTYLDYWGTVNGANLVGYGREEIVKAASEQMMKIQFTPTHEFSIPKIDLAKKLADITPGSLSRVCYASGGTESIETALKIAMKYQKIIGFPNKYKVIGTYTYHGSTYGAMSVGSIAPFTWQDFEPLVPGSVRVAHPWCSRCYFGLKYPDCNIRCARQVEQAIQAEVPETVAAFIDTPISSALSSFSFVPPPEYWPMVRSICDKYGVLLIFDCIVTGFGRTGKMFAAEHFDIVPDIMVLGKGLAGGYVPISVAIVTKEVAQKFDGGREEVLVHSYTFEGLPGSCAAALANLEIVEREKLVENSRIMGEYLFTQLQSLYKHKIVGEIWGGLGLMAQIALMKDKKTRKQFGPEENGKISGMLRKKVMDVGLFGMFTNPIVMCPSLSITRDEIDELVNGFDKVIGEIEEEL